MLDFDVPTLNLSPSKTNFATTDTFAVSLHREAGRVVPNWSES